MPLFTDDRCILRTEFLVAAFAVEGEGHDDGQYYLHMLLQVGTRRERLGVSYPTQAARDAALHALGVVAGDGAVFDEEDLTP
jgi:hypothetical protein